MFNMLLIYQGAIQPNAQMLLTANFGEEQMTKPPFQPREPPFALEIRASALLEPCDPGQGDRWSYAIKSININQAGDWSGAIGCQV